MWISRRIAPSSGEVLIRQSPGIGFAPLPGGLPAPFAKHPAERSQVGVAQVHGQGGEIHIAVGEILSGQSDSYRFQQLPVAGTVLLQMVLQSAGMEAYNPGHHRQTALPCRQQGGDGPLYLHGQRHFA